MLNVPGEEFEPRSYQLEGILSPKEWETVLMRLGYLGLSITPLNKNETLPGLENEPLSPVPYHLEEITSPTQFLSDEHIEEFWPEYDRQHRQSSLQTRRNCTNGGIAIVAHARPRRPRQVLTEREATLYRDHEMGIIVATRQSRGFADVANHPRNKYKAWAEAHRKMGPLVVRVDSFLRFVDTVSQLPYYHRPAGMTKAQIEYLQALAEKLHKQIVQGANNPDEALNT